MVLKLWGKGSVSRTHIVCSHITHLRFDRVPDVLVSLVRAGKALLEADIRRGSRGLDSKEFRAGAVPADAGGVSSLGERSLDGKRHAKR